MLHEFAPWLNSCVGKKRSSGARARRSTRPTCSTSARTRPTRPFSAPARGSRASRCRSRPRVHGAVLSAGDRVGERRAVRLRRVPRLGQGEHDNQAHFLVAARAYFLRRRHDVNFMAYFSNKYRDAFENKVRVGRQHQPHRVRHVGGARRGLLQQGSARVYVNGACVDSQLAAFALRADEDAVRVAAAARRRALPGPGAAAACARVRRRLVRLGRVPVPVRRVLEADQFQDYVNALDAMQQAAAIPGFNPASVPGANLLVPSQTNADGTPSRFNFVAARAPLRVHHPQQAAHQRRLHRAAGAHREPAGPLDAVAPSVSLEHHRVAHPERPRLHSRAGPQRARRHGAEHRQVHHRVRPVPVSCSASSSRRASSTDERRHEPHRPEGHHEELRARQDDGHGAARRRPGRREGRVHRRHGPVGLGQDDAAQHHRLPRPRRRRARYVLDGDGRRRTATSTTSPTCATRRSASSSRASTSSPCSTWPRTSSSRARCGRTPSRRSSCATACSSSPTRVGLGPVPAPQARRAVGRAAAARRHRARAHHRAAAGARRRADREPRLGDRASRSST